MATITTVFFDLDGTLADSAVDLAYALNQLLEEEQKQNLSIEEVRKVITGGAAAMLELGFGITSKDYEFDWLKQRFLQFYEQLQHQDTELFPNTTETLKDLEKSGYQWGIITNKHSYLAMPLIQKLGLEEGSACLVFGDTTKKAKPDPEPMLHACSELNILADQCLYIGDAQNDVIAAKAAGMQTCVALYGYIAEEDDPYSWEADMYIHSVSDIPQCLKLL